MTRNRAEVYRQRARQCLEIARGLSPGHKRAILTDMAQAWLGLAQEQEGAVTQQQQQIRADRDKGK